MIHKQYNEIMANSKKKFSNLYSAIDHGRSKILRTKWKPNVPGNKYYVSRNGRVYRNLGDGYWLRISVYSDGKSDGYLKCKINMKSWLLHRLIATIYLPIHVSSVKRILNGKGLIKYKDKFKNYEQ